jgi:aryl-alcohol dehydrogenase-like predicted oxidoreductase
VSLRADSDPTLARLFPSNDPVNKKIVAVVERIAKERGLPMAAISTAWCLSKGASPIIGLNSKERIDEATKAMKVTLNAEEIADLEAAYVPRNVTGY